MDHFYFIALQAFFRVVYDEVWKLGSIRFFTHEIVALMNIFVTSFLNVSTKDEVSRIPSCIVSLAT